jgi:transposase
MAKQLSNFENQVSLLLLAKTPTKDIATILNKSIKSIKNAASRIKRKKQLLLPEIKSKRGGISKLNLREKRTIKRDLFKSPKK